MIRSVRYNSPTTEPWNRARASCGRLVCLPVASTVSLLCMMYMYICVHLYVPMHVHMHVHRQVHVHEPAHAHVHMCRCMRVGEDARAWARAQARARVRMHVRALAYVQAQLIIQRACMGRWSASCSRTGTTAMQTGQAHAREYPMGRARASAPCQICLSDFQA